MNCINVASNHPQISDISDIQDWAGLVCGGAVFYYFYNTLKQTNLASGTPALDLGQLEL